MFTGIIEDVGTITGIVKSGGKWEFAVATALDTNGIALGDSIAIDGVCLTATRIGRGFFTADASLETLRVTTLSEKKTGSHVNLERAMAADGRFGGHIVMGHVDGIGSILEIRNEGESIRYTLEIPVEISRYVVKKGSVTIDGISLTVNDRHDNTFNVNIIPFTARKTTIVERSLRDRVNIETDIIGKYVESFLSKEKKEGFDLAFLYKYGYLKGD